MKKIVVIGGIAAIALLGFIVIQLLPASIWAESLSEEEIRDKVSRKYGGEIVDLVQIDEQFEVELKQETGMYALTLDAKSGEVVSLQQTESFAPMASNTPSDEDPNWGKDSDVPDDAGGLNVSNEQEQAGNGPQSGADIDPPEQPTSEDIQSNETNNPPEQKPVRPSRITADEAGKIAVNEIGGYVDDIDLEEIDGTLYYLVEVEFDDDLEAEVQIDVISGAIISIVWDD